jgi:hypothetical protein
MVGRKFGGVVTFAMVAPMFLIKWRNRSVSFRVITGLGRYTRENAEKQVAHWRPVFPGNSYYIERA